MLNNGKYKLQNYRIKYIGIVKYSKKNKIFKMKKNPTSCQECGENNSILTQVSNTVEILYLCSDCYKDKYSEETGNQIEN